MAQNNQMPQYHDLMNPLLRALKDLGGSGSIEEISSRVLEYLDLPDDILNKLHDPERSSQTEVEYRLAWARTYLKKYGILDNSERGVWVILPDKSGVSEVVTRTRHDSSRAAGQAGFRGSHEQPSLRR